MFKKRAISRIILAICILVFMISLSLQSFADVWTGNITLQDIDDNASTTAYNFTSNTTSAFGHLYLDNFSVGAVLIPTGGARVKTLDYFTLDEFYAHLNTTPPADFQDAQGIGYQVVNPIVDGKAVSYDPNAKRVIALLIPNGTGGWYHAMIWIENVTKGHNVTFSYRFNNQSNNNTFGAQGICEKHATVSACLGDVDNNCEWDDLDGGCFDDDQGDFNFDIPPPECEMLPKFGCDAINNTVCAWNATIGPFGKCKQGTLFDESTGYACGNITNSTFCNNQPFTSRASFCTWDNSVGTGSCQSNATKRIEDIPEPPVFFCESPLALNNQTLCQNLSDYYAMPCGWNNITNKCAFLFFDSHKFSKFEDISSESTCKSAGGKWKTETTFNPIANKISSESWCEFGVSVQTFNKVGGGGAGGFSGGGGQFNDCSVDCFACEFQVNGSVWGAGQAQSACESSPKGCKFRSDTNAFNGQGWCDPSEGFGGFDCNQFCGDCMAKPNPQGACVNSTANCRWDNATNFCSPQGVKGCSQSCTQCFDTTSCQLSTASQPSGCEWDSTSFFCKPKDGKFEICFDGVDNNQDEKIDCADPVCASDPFCGGASFAGASCFQFDSFTYGTFTDAHSNCSADANCNWRQQGAGDFGFCSPISDTCFENETMQTDQTECEGFNGGDTCVFNTDTRCTENLTMVSLCETYSTNESCMRANNTGCLWRSDLGGGFGECDTKAFFSCEMNFQFHNNQTACEQAGCYWQGDSFGSGFEGGYANHCVSPCFNISITDENGCAAANGTNFVAGTCAWQTGFCEPKNFIGGCIDNDGDYTACSENSNCNWFDEPFGPVADFNGSSMFENFYHPNEVWIAVGLQRPVFNGDGDNVSNYTLIRSADNVYLSLLSSNENVTEETDSASSVPDNVTQLLCNNEFILNYNWTTRQCEIGQCATYNKTAQCGGEPVHYYFNNDTGILEALWEVNANLLTLDASWDDPVVTNTAERSTVSIDGDLSDQYNESSTAGDGTNATRTRIATGFCDSLFVNNFFQGIDTNPPEILGVDAIGEANELYLDIGGIGVKKTPGAYMYGMTIANDGLKHSAICNSVVLDGGGIGQGTNKSKFFLYIDTDGKTTGGCSPENNLNLAGFEYRFKYIAEIDSDTGQLSETFLSQSCSSSSTWTPTNVPLKSDKKKSCSFIGGPIFAIDKDTFTGKSDVNTSVGWRVYGTSAGGTGNASAVNDSVGPSKSDFRGVDVKVIDCAGTADKDNSQCTKFKQFGFFPGEFGPACGDNTDNDGDGLTDCNDFDCVFDPFFCSGTYGSFSAISGDSTAPTIVWTKVNQKIPTSLTFIYDTNEPSNGTIFFFNKNATCTNTALNVTLNDTALEDGVAHTNYRPHHVSEIDNLNVNTTYFYKVKVCDPSNNCATTKCRNATTALRHSNITFKLVIPTNWTVDIPSMNLSNYSAQYALKASTEYLNNMNITIRSPSNDSAITFVGADIFEKQTLNVSRFLTGSAFVGFDANQYQNFKQKTGMDKVIIKIPASGTPDDIDHCDDSGASCSNVDEIEGDCTFGDGFAECEIPDAVGLGFSTYKAGTASSSSSSSSSSSGGGGGGGSSGGGGGGGAGLASTGTSTSRVWDQIEAFTSVTMDINNMVIPVTSVKFMPTITALGVELKVTVLDAMPLTDVFLESPVYEYFAIDHKNLAASEISQAEIDFKVDKSWLEVQNIDESNVFLARFSSNWDPLPTRLVSSDFEYSYYTASSPSLSYFAITGNPKAVESEASTAGSEAITLPTAEVIGAPQVTLTSEKGGMSGVTILVWIAVIAVLGGVVLVITRKKSHTKPKH